MTSVPDITRLLAWIAEWQEGHGKPGGRAEAARQGGKLLPHADRDAREFLGPAMRGRA